MEAPIDVISKAESKESSFELQGRGKTVSGPKVLRVGTQPLLCVPHSDPAYNTVRVYSSTAEKTIFDKATIGSQIHDTFFVPDSSASPSQATVAVLDEKNYYIADNGSGNGTRVDNVEKLEPYKSETLSVESRYLLIPDESEVTVLHIGPEQVIIYKNDVGETVIISANHREVVQPNDLHRHDFTIGNSDDNTFRFSNPAVATKQLSLSICGPVIVLQDLGSMSGSAVEVLSDERADDAFDKFKVKSVYDVIDTCDSVRSINGDRALLRTDNLAEQLKEVKVGSLILYLPKGRDELIEKYKNLYFDVEHELGLEFPLKNPVHVLVTPDSSYCENPAAVSNGFLVTNADSHPGAIAHELIHSLLDVNWGPSKSLMATEGAAWFFGKRIDPTDTRQDPRVRSLEKDDRRVLTESKSKLVGLSGEDYVTNFFGNDNKREAYEASYRLGAYLTEYIMKNNPNGKEIFFSFYRNTCRIDTERFTTQAQINAEALRMTAVEYNDEFLLPDHVSKLFNQYMRDQVRLLDSPKYVDSILKAA